MEEVKSILAGRLLKMTPRLVLRPILVIELLLPEASEVLLLPQLVDFLDLGRRQPESSGSQVVT